MPIEYTHIEYTIVEIDDSNNNITARNSKWLLPGDPFRQKKFRGLYQKNLRGMRFCEHHQVLAMDCHTTRKPRVGDRVIYNTDTGLWTYADQYRRMQDKCKPRPLKRLWRALTTI